MENNISQLPQSEDREFFRVDGKLYFHLEKVDLTEPHSESSRRVFFPPFTKDEDDVVGLSIDSFRERILVSEMEDGDFRQYILEMQQLMAMMKHCFDEELGGRKQKVFVKTTVNISGSGIAFPTDKIFCIDDILRLYLFFPAYPFTFLSIMGRVVKCVKKEEGFQVKAHFENISEQQRDEILRFVNQCQRDLLQGKHKDPQKNVPAFTPEPENS